MEIPSTKKAVTIYTTPDCQFCKELRAFLRDRQVPFTEHNIIDEPDKLDEMRHLTGGSSSVPVIVINKLAPDQRVYIGFDSTSLEKALL